MAGQPESRQTTSSSPSEGGSKPPTSGEETESVVCPICQKALRTITGTHLRLHAMTTAQFHQQFPDMKFQPPGYVKDRRAKALATWKQRYETDPAFTRKAKTTGRRLAEFRSSLTDEQNQVLQHRSMATCKARYTKEQRSAQSRMGGIAAWKKYPNLESFRKEARSVFWNSPKSTEARQTISQASRKRWQNPEYRRHISETNRKAAIDGRIPLRPTLTRPSASEKLMIDFLHRHEIPMQYTGDNRLRIDIPQGDRSWRNPDFILPGTQKAILLDICRWWGQKAENLDYQKTDWTVLRILVKELQNEAELVAKIRAFLSGSKSSP